MNHELPHAIRYQTPETPDGVVRRVQADESGRATVSVEIEFKVSREFKERCQGSARSVAFAARSRIARLGIDVEPTSEIAFENGREWMLLKVIAAKQDKDAATVEFRAQSRAAGQVHVLNFNPVTRKFRSLRAVHQNSAGIPGSNHTGDYFDILTADAISGTFGSFIGFSASLLNCAQAAGRIAACSGSSVGRAAAF